MKFDYLLFVDSLLFLVLPSTLYQAGGFGRDKALVAIPI